MGVTAASRVVLMIGHPVAQTVMPGCFNAWASETGADAVMVPLDVPPEGFMGVMELLRRAPNLAGAVITAPHKQAAARAVDAMSDAARLAGAVNVVARRGSDSLWGDNTDGAGLLAAMTAHGVDPKGLRALILGCGGAGSAIAVALAQAGATLDLTDPQGDRAAALAAALGPQARAIPSPEDVSPYRLIVNASAVGLYGNGLPHDLAGLAPGTLVADVVTSPERTPFLTRAAAQGAPIQTGAEMAAAQLPLVLDLLGFAGIDKYTPFSKQTF
ncbi:hypothetical protein ATO6_10820 [Oceanicola sp. 22II-s10i]|uniref:shikimate dehydrogenase family protein n=1 Tax=Oceanicola sp. 22II-s10i TaxID=1317116 RepID=UPI000B62BA65|nr:shikimate dehydrogenase [Oceanicola sp. 22II-s10i]OWU84804.1 hypothetical protein ATO6_10820 [Oceanicola sp. 22II-s10i]